MTATVGLRVIHVTTRLATVDDFVHRFWHFCGDDTMQLPAAEGAVKGTVSRFVVSLADGEPALAGRMQVLDSRMHQGARYLRVRLLDLDDASHSVHGRMLKMRSEKDAARLASSRAAPPPRASLPPPAFGSALPPPSSVPPPPPPGVMKPGSDADLDQLHTLVTGVTFDEDSSTDAAIPIAGIPAAESTPVRLPPLPGPEKMVSSELGPEDKTPGPITIPLPPSGFSDDIPVLLPPPGQRNLGAGALTPGTTSSRYTGKSMVARPGGGALDKFLEKIPEAYRPAVVRWGPLALVALVIFLVGRWTAGGDEPSSLPRTEVAGAVVADEGATDEQPAEGEEQAGTDEEANAEHLKMPDCRATIESDPAGAPVLWGDRPLGETPLEGVKVPCGRTLVAIAHPRYEKVVRNVSVTLDEMQLIREKLQRPEASIVLTSSPAGATIWVGEKAVGTTPGRLGVKRYEALALKVEKAGYKTWSREVYVGKVEEEVDVQLRPERKGRGKKRSR